MKKFLALGLCLFVVNSFAARVKLTPNVKKQVINVLKANENLHGAFFTYDGKKTESAAKELMMKISMVSKSAVKNDLSKSISELKLIKSTNKRDANNEAYAKASLFLVTVVNKYDVGKEYNNYSCPMVKKKWVQNSKKMKRTHNPYAPEMPHCGGRDTDY